MASKTMCVFKKLFDHLPKNIHKLIFYSQASKYKVISNGAANKVLKNTLDDLKIDEISVHGLRHTHMSVLLYQGVLTERLVPLDIETTMNTFAHIVKKLRKEDEEKTTKLFMSMV